MKVLQKNGITMVIMVVIVVIGFLSLFVGFQSIGNQKSNEGRSISLKINTINNYADRMTKESITIGIRSLNDKDYDDKEGKRNERVNDDDDNLLQNENENRNKLNSILLTSMKNSLELENIAYSNLHENQKYELLWSFDQFDLVEEDNPICPKKEIESMIYMRIPFNLGSSIQNVLKMKNHTSAKKYVFHGNELHSVSSLLVDLKQTKSMDENILNELYPSISSTEGKITLVDTDSLFLNISKASDKKKKRPLLITFIRDPVQRFVMHYYYKRRGLSHGQYMDINVCEKKTAGFKIYHSCLNLTNDFFTAQDIRTNNIAKLNIVTTYFCGYDPKKCANVTWKQKSHQAITNMKRSFWFVGITENMPVSFAILRKVSSSFFKNVITPKETLQYSPLSSKDMPSKQTLLSLKKLLIHDFMLYSAATKMLEKKVSWCQVDSLS